MSNSENEQLRLSNSRLAATVEELKLEISYYKGEVKRIEWEKDLLNQDVRRMSSLFKRIVSDAEAKSAIENPLKIKLGGMVKYPCRSIAELLQLKEKADIMFLTSSQPPHFIEVIMIEPHTSALLILTLQP